MDQETMDSLHESLVALATGFNDIADTMDEVTEALDRLEDIIEGMVNPDAT